MHACVVCLVHVLVCVVCVVQKRIFLCNKNECVVNDVGVQCLRDVVLACFLDISERNPFVIF